MLRRNWISALSLAVFALASPTLHAEAQTADAFVKQVSTDVMDAVKAIPGTGTRPTSGICS